MTRQPKKQKLKCASYDWERGLGTCHNCNSNRFNYIHIESKGVTPIKRICNDLNNLQILNILGRDYGLDDKVTEWFKTRGISPETLLDCRVGQGSEYMPQTGKSENTIKFNYFIGDQIS